MRTFYDRGDKRPAHKLIHKEGLIIGRLGNLQVSCTQCAPFFDTAKLLELLESNFLKAKLEINSRKIPLERIASEISFSKK